MIKKYYFIVSVCLLLTPGGSLRAQKSMDSVVFVFKGSAQFWVVPAGVTTAHVEAYGAQGGSDKGGKGGRVQADVKVTPGDKMMVCVGGQPSNYEGGWNGGGAGCGKGTGGGGASDLRSGGTGLSARILVAGGGGGVGYGGVAGLGGGLTGGEGRYDTTSHHLAKGGSQEAGGVAARAYGSKAGESGIGGEGISNRGQCTNGAMAGGGGGYYGGGAGGAGGAGGGSSYADPKLTSNVKHDQGVSIGNGKIVISWSK